MAASSASREDTEASAAAPAAAGTLASLYQQAANRLRDSAKWLVASFGAAAAAVVAGISLSGIGALDFATPNFRFSIALAGVAAAAAGVLGALVTAIGLASASTVTAAELRGGSGGGLDRARAVINDPYNGYLLNEPSFAAFCERHLVLRGAWAERIEDYYEHPTDQSRLQLAYNIQARKGTYDEALREALRVASYERLRAAFGSSRLWIVLWLTLATAGAVAFAWAASPPEDTKLQQAPREAVLRVNQSARADVLQQVGADCDLGALRVVVLRVTEGVAEVVSVPSAQCAPARLEITDAVGQLHDQAPPLGG